MLTLHLKRSFLYRSLYVLLGVLVVLIPLELLVRGYILVRSFSYLEVRRDEFPFFSLCERYETSGVTIRNSRREYYKRGNRPQKVAFVGDSVTFGHGAVDRETYVELMQAGQDTFDAYNFGVPGYGLPEVANVIDRIAEGGQFEAIVYTYGFNDVYPAMAGYLSLLTSSETRFATIEEFGGVKGRIKLFVKDHLKSGVLLRDMTRRVFHGTRSMVPGDGSRGCEEDIRVMARAAPFAQSYYALGVMYDDRELVQKLERVLVGLKRSVESSGAAFIVVIHYDYLLVERSGEFFEAAMDGVLARGKIRYVDTYPLYRDGFRTCGFYSDPTHLGVAGQRRLSNLVQEEVLASLRGRMRSGRMAGSGRSQGNGRMQWGR